MGDQGGDGSWRSGGRGGFRGRGFNNNAARGPWRGGGFGRGRGLGRGNPAGGQASAHHGLEEVRIQEGEVDLHILAPFEVHRAPWPDSAMRDFLDATKKDLQAALDKGIANQNIRDTVISMRTKLLEVDTALSGSSNNNEDKWYTDNLLRGKLKELLAASRQLAECLVREALQSQGINPTDAASDLRGWVQAYQGTATTSAMQRFAEDLHIVRKCANSGAHWGPMICAEDHAMIACRYVVALISRLKIILPTGDSSASTPPSPQPPPPQAHTYPASTPPPPPPTLAHTLPPGQNPDIFLKNLPADMHNSELYDLCAPYGVVTDQKVIKDKRIGFVTFLTPSAAAHAIRELNGKMHYGNSLIAMPKMERQAPSGKPSGGYQAPPASNGGAAPSVSNGGATQNISSNGAGGSGLGAQGSGEGSSSSTKEQMEERAARIQLQKQQAEIEKLKKQQEQLQKQLESGATVEIEGGGHTTFPVDEEATVEDLKEYLFEKTGLHPQEQRVTSSEGKDVLMMDRGIPRQMKDYKITPGSRLKMSTLYSAVAGQSSIVGVKTDVFGNAAGEKFDLGLNKAFTGMEVGVLHLYATELFDFKLPQEALNEKGFKVTRWTSSSIPTPAELKQFLDRPEVRQLWVISDARRHLSQEHLAVIKEYFNKGLGVYIWGDNDPYYADANALGNELLGVTMSGNDEGDKTLSLRKEGEKTGLTENHAVTTAIENLYEGITIASLEPDPAMKPIIMSSAGKVVCGVYENGGKRLVMDGGFTRLYCHWDTAGTARFVKNAAVWLTNYDAAVKRLRIERPYKIDKTPSHEINWQNIGTHHGVSIKQEVPTSIKHLLYLVQEGKPLEETCKPVHMKVAPEPFSDEGGTRLPYHARVTKNAEGELSPQLLVAKKSRYTSKTFDSCEAYKAQMEIQSVAAFLALHFNKISGAPHQVPALKYSKCKTFSGKGPSGEKTYFTYEVFIHGGSIIKFNSNVGYVNQEDYVAAVHAFSHWTWHATGGRLMVVDVQGLFDDVRKQYTLFDPAIHCVTNKQRFGRTNLKQQGIDGFFATHTCNAVCERLRLAKPKTSSRGTPRESVSGGISAITQASLGSRGASTLQCSEDSDF